MIILSYLFSLKTSLSGSESTLKLVNLVFFTPSTYNKNKGYEIFFGEFPESMIPCTKWPFYCLSAGSRLKVGSH